MGQLAFTNQSIYTLCEINLSGRPLHRHSVPQKDARRTAPPGEQAATVVAVESVGHSRDVVHAVEGAGREDGEGGGGGGRGGRREAGVGWGRGGGGGGKGAESGGDASAAVHSKAPQKLDEKEPLEVLPPNHLYWRT